MSWGKELRIEWAMSSVTVCSRLSRLAIGSHVCVLHYEKRKSTKTAVVNIKNIHVFFSTPISFMLHSYVHTVITLQQNFFKYSLRIFLPDYDLRKKKEKKRLWTKTKTSYLWSASLCLSTYSIIPLVLTQSRSPVITVESRLNVSIMALIRVQ